jgi:hypothetical protein
LTTLHNALGPIKNKSRNNKSKALAGFQCQSLPQTASELQGFLQRLSMQAGKKNEF